MSTTSINTLVAAQVSTAKDLENLRGIVKDNLSDIGKLIDALETMHERSKLHEQMMDTLKEMIKSVARMVNVAPNAWTMADTSTEVTNEILP
jgi:UDP-2,3-diacylglucosamine pyrophosphatase LpxH